jgi:hypothetical protein
MDDLLLERLARRFVVVPCDRTCMRLGYTRKKKRTGGCDKNAPQEDKKHNMQKFPCTPHEEDIDETPPNQRLQKSSKDRFNAAPYAKCERMRSRAVGSHEHFLEEHTISVIFM